MNFEKAEFLENLTAPERNTKELVQSGDKIKIALDGAVIICNHFKDYVSETHYSQPEESQPEE